MVSFITADSRGRFLPMLVVMAVIFYLSHQPGDTLSLPDIFGIDKVLHGLAYAGLATAALFAVYPHINGGNKNIFALVIILFCFFYGVSDELHQYFIPNRTASIWDITADTIGAILVVIANRLVMLRG